MKIKLVTFAPHPNFGTCLQAYALNTVVRRLGHDVEFIYNGRENPPPTIRSLVKKLLLRLLPKAAVQKIKQRKKALLCEILTPGAAVPATSAPCSRQEPYILKIPNHYLLWLASRIPGYQKLYLAMKRRNLQWAKVVKFTYEDGNFQMRRLYARPDYREVVKDADLFLTGSDQIWNPYCGGFNPFMFLEFAGEKRRIAYSSSIARPSIPASVQERMRAGLSRFSHIAVREKESVELLNRLLGRKDVRLVVDPTCLLSAEEWRAFGRRAELEFPVPERFIFCYFVGSERRDVYARMVEEAKAFTGIQTAVFLECYNRDFTPGGGRLYRDAGPYEWVCLLDKASYVCTDSFHATIFALKFEKEFVHALKNSDARTGSQNTRIYDLLGRYGLLFKLYEPGVSRDWQKTADYTEVTPVIADEIRDSLDYLKDEIYPPE